MKYKVVVSQVVDRVEYTDASNLSAMLDKLLQDNSTVIKSVTVSGLGYGGNAASKKSHGNSQKKSFGGSTIPDEKIKQIYAFRKSGRSIPETAKHFGVSVFTVHQIEHGRGRYGKLLGIKPPGPTHLAAAE